MSADFKLAISVLLILLGLSFVPDQDVKRRPIHTSGLPPEFVSDSFTEASDVLLGSHTGELGATWTVHPSYGNVMNVDAATDRIYPTSNPSGFTASGTPPSADYRACVDVFAHSNISMNFGPCVRMDTVANTMYCARYDSGTIYQLRKILAGVQSTMTSSTNQLITLGTSKTLCVHASGTNIWMTVNGVTEGSVVVDTNITAAGKAGLRSAGGATATTGFHLDNFSAR